MPISTLLEWSAAPFGIAVIARRFSNQRLRLRTMVVAIAIGILSSALSTVRYAERSAGTGTYGTRGWPRAVYARWMSWEIPTERHEGFQLRGLVENAVFYSAAAAALLSLGLVLAKRVKPGHFRRTLV